MNKELNVRITEELKSPTEMGRHYRLLCMTGSSKGKVYYLLGKRITIGRGDNADIQVIDVKMSREHAELSFSGNGYTLTDLGAQNGILINSIQLKQKKILDADKIVVGQTVFKYNIFEITKSEIVATSNGDENTSFNESSNSKKNKIQSEAKPSSDSIKGKRKDKNNPKGIIVLILLIVAGYFLFFDAGESFKQAASENRSSVSIKDFDKDLVVFSDNKKNTQEDVESKKRLDNYIHSGRREFGEGNYFRAMEDFRLALLLSPNNGHASFYLSKAKQSLDDDINKNFLKGKQESESKKFQAAIVSYCGVVQLIQNYPDDERYKSAMMKISALESELGMEKGEIKCIEEKSADSKN
jgi:hypothetical protein